MTAQVFSIPGGDAAVAKRLSPAGLARRAYGTAVVMLIPLNLLYLLTSSVTSSGDAESFINLAGPCCFIGILGFQSHRLRTVPDSIWTALFWLPVQSAVFFGFGPLSGVVGKIIRPALSASSLGYFPVTTEELFRANQLSTCGVTLLLAGFWLQLHFREQKWRSKQSTQHGVLPALKPEVVGLTFVFAGAALKYLLLQPAQWGSFKAVVPGALSSLSSLTDVGFAVIAYLAVRGSRNMRSSFIILWPFHFFLCILTFAKTDLVMALLLPLIGVYAARPTVRTLVVGVGLIAICYMAAQPWVTYGRAVVYERTGTITNAGYAERLGILDEYVFSRTAIRPAKVDNDQGWWKRLDYSEVQARAMVLHDRGVRNPSFDGAWMYFIPRAIWAGKPIMNGPAVNFYRLVTGNYKTTSRLGVSIYGDLYWKFGWSGILIGCMLIGWLFAELAAASITAMRNREFIMLPAVLLALQMAIQAPTEFVVASIVGPLVVYVGYILLLRLIAALARGTRHAQQQRMQAV